MRALSAGFFVLALLCSGCEEAGRVASPGMRAFEGPRDLAPFTLTDHHGQPFDRNRLLGHWTFLTFGYASCPDVCPTMLVNLAELKRALASGWTGAEPQFVFVSVDPARDNLEVLARYAPAFDPQFLGATGTQDALNHMHRDFGGAHRLNKPHTTLRRHYAVDHSVLLFVIDPDGRLSAQVAPPFDPAALARSIAPIAHAFAQRQAVATTAPRS